MKTFTKIVKIIAIGAVIAVGLIACISISPAPEKTEEELTFENVLKNAQWEVKVLANQPPLNGFVKLASSSIDFDFFRSFGQRYGDPEVSANAWYELTATELPGVIYYYYKEGGGMISILNLYKKQ
jgi:hypothetical protein